MADSIVYGNFIGIRRLPRLGLRVQFGPAVYAPHEAAQIGAELMRQAIDAAADAGTRLGVPAPIVLTDDEVLALATYLEQGRDSDTMRALAHNVTSAAQDLVHASRSTRRKD